MAAYRRVYDSRRLQADCQEPGSTPEPYARQSSNGCLFIADTHNRSTMHHKTGQSNLRNWTALRPNPVRQSIHLSMFHILQCVNMAADK